MLEISKEHLDKFEEIKKQFYGKTEMPRENAWRSLTNDELWWEIIVQVIVVGKSEPGIRSKEDTKLRNQVSYEELKKIEEEELRKKINHVLRAVGTRYASSDISKCGKRALGRPEEFAQAALYLASDASSFVTGIALVVDGGGLAWSG